MGKINEVVGRAWFKTWKGENKLLYELGAHKWWFRSGIHSSLRRCKRKR